MTNKVEVLTALGSLLSSYQSYAQARRCFLEQINLPTSCRDPLAEVSEVLVAQLLNATAATSRVQKGYDLVGTDGRRIQVKYLANARIQWVNEHAILFTDDVDDYALVIFTAFDIESVLVFSKEGLSTVCQQLKKRHPYQERQLQFIRRNYNSIIQNQAMFLEIGVKIFSVKEAS